MDGYADFEHLIPAAPKQTGNRVLTSHMTVVARMIFGCAEGTKKPKTKTAKDPLMPKSAAGILGMTVTRR